jgi:D-tyrosyl-tRNA(Tyr) deacylase
VGGYRLSCALTQLIRHSKDQAEPSGSPEKLMIGLLQRVSEASVEVDGLTVGAIGAGLLVLLGVERDDSEREAERLLERIVTYRVFDDAEGRMNRSLLDLGGALLVVSQFTLAAETRSGTRPGFSTAAPPAAGRRLYEHFLARARGRVAGLASGTFGASMRVRLVNDGPVTFWLQVAPQARTG